MAYGLKACSCHPLTYIHPGHVTSFIELLTSESGYTGLKGMRHSHEFICPFKVNT